MKVTELAARSGVTLSTVKYYLREGLVPPGVPVTATTSEYDDSHVARVRLVRALADSAGLRVADVARVLAVLDDVAGPWPEVLARAHRAATRGGPGGPQRGPGSRTPRADRLVRSQGWRVRGSSSLRLDLEEALQRAEAAGLRLGSETLDRYAEAAHTLAEIDLAEVVGTRGAAPAEAARQARLFVAGLVVTEPVVTALRRLAQEDVSNRVGSRRARPREA